MKKEIAETSNKMVVLYLMKSKIDSIGVIKFYYVITGWSINQSSKKCFWMGNNDIEEYNMDT